MFNRELQNFHLSSRLCTGFLFIWDTVHLLCPIHLAAPVHLSGLRRCSSLWGLALVPPSLGFDPRGLPEHQYLLPLRACHPKLVPLFACVRTRLNHGIPSPTVLCFLRGMSA